MATSYNWAYNAPATCSGTSYNQPPVGAVDKTQASIASNYAQQCAYDAQAGNLFVSSGSDHMPWITVGAFRLAPPYAVCDRTWPRSMLAS